MTEPIFILLTFVLGVGIVAIDALMWYLKSRKKNKAINDRFENLR